MSTPIQHEEFMKLVDAVTRLADTVQTMSNIQGAILADHELLEARVLTLEANNG